MPVSILNNRDINETILISMKQKVIALFSFLFLTISLFAQAPEPGKQSGRPALTEKKMAAYLFVFFDDKTHSLFMATSHDGYTFTVVNNGKPVIAGDTIADQKGIRDPYIYRGPDGSFYLAMTDLHLSAQQKGYRTTRWEQDEKEFGWGNNRGFVLMKSADLIHWTRTNLHIENAFNEKAGCVWAPETHQFHLSQTRIYHPGYC